METLGGMLGDACEDVGELKEFASAVGPAQSWRGGCGFTFGLEEQIEPRKGVSVVGSPHCDRVW